MKVLLTLAAVLATAAAPAPQAPLRMNDIQVVGSHNRSRPPSSPNWNAATPNSPPRWITTI
jgi:hypothetical protein